MSELIVNIEKKGGLNFLKDGGGQRMVYFVQYSIKLTLNCWTFWKKNCFFRKHADFLIWKARGLIEKTCRISLCWKNLWKSLIWTQICNFFSKINRKKINFFLRTQNLNFWALINLLVWSKSQLMMYVRSLQDKLEFHLVIWHAFWNWSSTLKLLFTGINMFLANDLLKCSSLMSYKLHHVSKYCL